MRPVRRRGKLRHYERRQVASSCDLTQSRYECFSVINIYLVGVAGTPDYGRDDGCWVVDEVVSDGR